MRITQEGEIKDGKIHKKFINSMEGIKYPWYLIMYHPEYQLIDFVGKKKWELSEHTELAEEIAYRISLFLKK